VKPQLQQQLQASQMEVELDIVDDVDISPSPSSPQMSSMMSQVTQPQYQPFQMGTSQFIAPEPRVNITFYHMKCGLKAI
jgi:hypothetical protein